MWQAVLDRISQPVRQEPVFQSLNQVGLGSKCIPTVHNCAPLVCIDGICQFCNTTGQCSPGQGQQNVCVHAVAATHIAATPVGISNGSGSGNASGSGSGSRRRLLATADGASVITTKRKPNTVAHIKSSVHIVGGVPSKCVHKELFPTSALDIFGSVLSFSIGMVSAASGLGGGGALVPVYMLLMGFDAHGSVPLSKATVFGGGIANVIFFSQMRHPLTDKVDRPRIDYDAAGVFVPLTLLGTVFGVMANKILPAWLIMTSLFVILGWVTTKTFSKAFKKYAEETQQKEEEGHSLVSGPINSPLTVVQGKNPELDAIIEAERRVPWLQISHMFMLWFTVMLLSLAKGGHGKSLLGVKCGGILYWLLVASIFPVTLGFSYVYGQKLLATYRKKKELGYPFLSYDVHWNERNVFLYPFYVVWAGFFAGCVGLGSATITAPMMILLGMEAQVVAATAAFILLFTASSTSVQFLIVGAMPLSYATFLWLLGFVSAVTGQLTIGRLVKKYQRSSVVIFIVAFILGLSAVLLSYTGVLYLILDIKTNSAGLRPLCS